MTKTLDIAIVTYNRLEKLKKALLHYEQQTSAFRNLIIVNNCSTDGTSEFLKEYCSQEHYKFQTVLINTDENLGGSGGFYLGQKKALELNADWVMVADDDAYAAPDMVEQFYKYVDTHKVNTTAAICAVVVNNDGSICTHHRSHCNITALSNSWIYQEKKIVDTNIDEYLQDSFLIDITTYVGTFLNAKALKKVGLVNPNYFIYYDDFEHSLRLQKYGKIIIVNSIKITHDNISIVTEKTDNIITWREFYIKRNEAHMLLHHYPRVIIKDYLFLFRCILGAWIHHTKTSIYEDIDRKAKLDALFGKLGKHKIYRPGWIYKK